MGVDAVYVISSEHLTGSTGPRCRDAVLHAVLRESARLNLMVAAPGTPHDLACRRAWPEAVVVSSLSRHVAPPQPGDPAAGVDDRARRYAQSWAGVRTEMRFLLRLGLPVLYTDDHVEMYDQDDLVDAVARGTAVPVDERLVAAMDVMYDMPVASAVVADP